jgi:CHRD domain/PEP-CTERM motif
MEESPMEEIMTTLKLLTAVLCLVPAAQASIIVFVAPLSGANENPATVSLGTGAATITVNNVANTININVSFSGLTAGDTAAHIHCCVAPGGNAGVATVQPSFPGFPLGVTSGSINMLFSLLDPAFYNPSFITANGGTAASAEAVLLSGMTAGQTYFNIHTGTNPGGEIRGFLVAIPEPGTFVLAGLALAGLTLSRRRSAFRSMMGWGCSKDDRES